MIKRYTCQQCHTTSYYDEKNSLVVCPKCCHIERKIEVFPSKSSDDIFTPKSEDVSTPFETENIYPNSIFGGVNTNPNSIFGEIHTNSNVLDIKYKSVRLGVGIILGNFISIATYILLGVCLETTTLKATYYGIFCALASLIAILTIVRLMGIVVGIRLSTIYKDKTYTTLPFTHKSAVSFCLLVFNPIFYYINYNNLGSLQLSLVEADTVFGEDR